MAFGASLFSSVALSWEEFVDFANTLPQRIGDITVSADVNSAFHEIGVKTGDGDYLVAILKQQDDGVFERPLEEMSQQLGIPQHTLIQMDMSSYSLAREIAKAFAEKYPCTFDFGNNIIEDRHDLLNN